ncbi:hypothetical protein F5B20DRAFT_244806 [Whalleya microplaca]|nr:hypothetical protein F5B20DRAFT_244806 [Whalleya microplaca]
MALRQWKWSPRRWSISRWLLLIRLLQAAGTLVTATMNGFLLAYIHLHRLGFAESMFCLEMMACIALIYSAVVLLVQHTGSQRRRSKTSLIAAFIVGDVVFNGLTIAIITILARTGVPSDCHGLTRDDVEQGDSPDIPPPGYDTIRFGDETDDERGLLDKYCALEGAFYFIAVALVFTYMVTVTLGVLRICERHYTKNTELLTTVENARRRNHTKSKMKSSKSITSSETPAPASEGVIGPDSMVSSAMSSRNNVSATPVHTHTFHESQEQQPQVPVSPVSAASPISQVSPISPIMLDTSMGGLMIGNSPEQSAEAAMVTDGYRPPQQPGMPSLPPYTPGPSRGQFMDGHGNESNEMRLSDYVKGETRAQNSKQ